MHSADHLRASLSSSLRPLRPRLARRFEAFPIQEDEHLPTVVRYVVQNPLRGGLPTRAEDWRWSSLGPDIDAPDWTDFVNGLMTEE